MICLCCIMSCFEIFLSQDGVFQRFTGFTKNKKSLCQQWWRLLVKNSIISQFPETSSVLTFWLISGFKKIASLRPVTLLKKGLWHRCFPVDFAKLLRTPFFTEQLQWLLWSVNSACKQINLHRRSYRVTFKQIASY